MAYTTSLREIERTPTHIIQKLEQWGEADGRPVPLHKYQVFAHGSAGNTAAVQRFDTLTEARKAAYGSR